MRKIVGSLVLGVLVGACGGGGEAVKPVEAPAAPTVAPPTPPTPEVTPAPTAEAPAKPSAQDAAKALVGAVSDSLNTHDLAKFTATYTDDAVLVVAGNPEPIKGREAIGADTKRAFDAFPNLKMGFSRVWAKGDVYVCEWVDTATHSGDLMGIKATEKPVGYTGLSIVWVNADGKIKEEHRYLDLGTVLAQVGASKAKARPVATLPTSIEWHFAKSDAAEDKGVEGLKSAYAAFEKKDDKAMGDMSADDITWDDLLMPAPMKGKADAVKYWKTFMTAFPDLKAPATNSWGVEDFAIAEIAFTGTPKGAIMGLTSQTKKPVTLHIVDIVQMKDGKVTKGWSYGNGVELLMQFGLMRPPGGPAVKPEPKPPTPKTDGKGATPKTDTKPIKK